MYELAGVGMYREGHAAIGRDLRAESKRCDGAAGVWDPSASNSTRHRVEVHRIGAHGGARIDSPRLKVCTMIIGWPQCQQTNVGGLASEEALVS